jgi:hypothetical protein
MHVGTRVYVWGQADRLAGRQTDRLAYRQTGWHTDRQAGIQTDKDRQADKQTDRPVLNTSLSSASRRQPLSQNSSTKRTWCERQRNKGDRGICSRGAQAGKIESVSQSACRRYVMHSGWHVLSMLVGVVVTAVLVWVC